MNDIIELLKKTGALLEGHFLLSSGRHSDKYFQCAKLLQYPDKARIVFEYVVKNILKDNLEIDFVAGPAMGGIIAAWEVGRQLGLPAIFTERDDTGSMTLRRGFELQKGQKVLIVEDVVTTGKSSLECAAAIESSGGVIAALTCIVDRRSEGVHDVIWPFYPAIKMPVGNWDASECDLCKQGLPLIKPGSRKI